MRWRDVSFELSTAVYVDNGCKRKRFGVLRPVMRRWRGRSVYKGLIVMSNSDRRAANKALGSGAVVSRRSRVLFLPGHAMCGQHSRVTWSGRKGWQLKSPYSSKSIDRLGVRGRGQLRQVGGFTG